jgi:L-lactate dehydrogenase complex protein LldG
MSAREAILQAIRANRPTGDYPLPAPTTFPLSDPGLLMDVFVRNLESMGGSFHEGTVTSAIEAVCPHAQIVASTVPEVASAFVIDSNTAINTLAEVDVAVVRAAFCVAETGSVLLTDELLRRNAIAYLAQHLVVLLDPAELVPTLHEAYRRPELSAHHYASFHTGPSATADIEGVLIHGAQGVRSLTVVLSGAR